MSYQKLIELRANKSVAEYTDKNFQGDFESNKQLMYDTYIKGDETGVMFYEYTESKGGNRVMLKGTDPCGDGFINILVKY